MFKTKRKPKIPVVILLLVCVLVTVIIYKVNYIMTAEPANVLQTEKIDVVDSSDSFNVLLVGTDAGGVLTDSIMLVNVNKKTEQISMLSLPRDTKVKINGKNRKLNSCYGKGGLDLLIEKVKDLTGAPVHYYAVIKPGILAKIVDELGGVKVDVEQDMHYSDPSQDLYIDLKEGTQTLNGDEAEQYCRYRSYAMGDLERTRTQQKFFKALFEQKLSIKYVTKLSDIYSIIQKEVKTNVSFSDVAKNLSVLSIIKNADSINCLETPGEFNDVRKDGTSYYLIQGADKTELRELGAQYFLAPEQSE